MSYLSPHKLEQLDAELDENNDPPLIRNSLAYGGYWFRSKHGQTLHYCTGHERGVSIYTLTRCGERMEENRRGCGFKHEYCRRCKQGLLEDQKKMKGKKK